MPLSIPPRIESEGHFFVLGDLALEESGAGGSFTVCGLAPRDVHRDWTLLPGDATGNRRIFITSASQLPRFPARPGEAQAPARSSCHFLWYVERARLLIG